MNDIEAILLRAEKRLNKSLTDYEDTGSKLATEFRELKLQASIFQYDICAEMACLIRHERKGFARKVAFKGLIHKIYEYEKLLSTHLISQMLDLAQERRIQIRHTDIKSEKRQWKQELARLKQWSAIRNEATGHYGKDIESQVRLLRSIDEEEVMSVTQAFLTFNMSILQMLKGTEDNS
jgi:hypothetical protein